MKSNDRVTIYVNYEHLTHYKSMIDLSVQILENCWRYKEALQSAAMRFLKYVVPEYA